MTSQEGGDGIRSRIREGRLWLLLRVNRWVLVGAVLAVICWFLVAASHLGLAPFRRIAVSHNGVRYLFSSFIGAIITGTSVVVTINQLVLSQELGAVGDQRSRMTAAMDFRDAVEDHFDLDVSPPEPAGFLYELVDGVDSRATDFAAAARADDPDLAAAAESYVEDLSANAEEVRSGLEDAQFGTFDVVWNAFRFNYSRKIHDAHRLRADHGDSFSQDTAAALEDVIEGLTLFGPAREHFKTLYFQWELINLSRSLLYTAISALAVMGALIMYVDSAAITGTTLGTDNLVWVASVGFVVGISPFVVFTVFIVRIVSIAKRTLAMGPFILRESERDQDLG